VFSAGISIKDSLRCRREKQGIGASKEKIRRKLNSKNAEQFDLHKKNSSFPIEDRRNRNEKGEIRQGALGKRSGKFRQRRMDSYFKPFSQLS